MIDIYNNKESFLRNEPRMFFKLLLCLIIISFIFLIILSFIKIYDHHQTKGYATCSDTCIITTYIPSEIKYDFISFNNKNIDYKILREEIIISEEEMRTIKKITIETDNIFLDQEIINLNFYYNKQRIIIKIKDMMF